MVIDRKKAPPIIPIRNLHIPPVEHYELANGLKVYVVGAGTQDILKIELVSMAGRSNEVDPLSSKLYAGTVKEGTKTKSSSEIATLIDYYGATISSRSGMDSTSLTLYCLHKHLESILPLYMDILVNPIFPEKEIQKFKKRSAEKLTVQLAKNEVLAYRKITEMIFGENHPYGYNSYPDSYEALTQGLAERHFNNKIMTKDSFVIISGKVTTSCMQVVKDQLSQVELKDSSENEMLPHISEAVLNYSHIGKNDYQTAIRIGKKLHGREHKDFVSSYVTNTLLGGYFGSRLMSTIREEKGYTYGIFSMIDIMKHDSYFYISTEVANHYVEPTIDAIKNEIELLKNHKTQPEELQMVKNYIMGSFMTMVDGPFKTSDVLKTLLISNLDFTYLHSFLEEIQKVSADNIQENAQKYMDWDTLYKVTVGQNTALTN